MLPGGLCLFLEVRHQGGKHVEQDNPDVGVTAAGHS